MLQLGILVSGSGSNLQAILDAIASHKLDARACVVISNKPGVFALARAESAGVPAETISHKDFPTRDLFDAQVVSRLRFHGVDTVVLAGFMRIVTPVLLDAYRGRVVNIHPSLLPAFPGVDAQAQALRAGVRITGCTVHFVDAGMDTGPIVVQAAVPVCDGDAVETLRDRILVMEHRILPAALQWLSEGRVRIADGVVRIDGGDAAFAVTSPSLDRTT